MNTLSFNPLFLSRLSRINHSLLPSEHALLDALATVRVATVDQLTRIVSDDPDVLKARRGVRKRLLRLSRLDLVRRFPNTARDRKFGPAGFVYALTRTGCAVTRRPAGPETRQRRSWRPHPSYLDHWLAITELYVHLVANARDGSPQIREFRVESDALRPYQDYAGHKQTVRPDAVLRLATEDVEVSWFLEIDRATERPTVLLEKCRSYRGYELSGIEHEQHGVFPGVMFVVPDDHRARVVDRVIAAQPREARGLFHRATEAEVLTALWAPAKKFTPGS